jgi:hypothetical protein
VKEKDGQVVGQVLVAAHTRALPKSGGRLEFGQGAQGGATEDLAGGQVQGAVADVGKSDPGQNARLRDDVAAIRAASEAPSSEAGDAGGAGTWPGRGAKGKALPAALRKAMRR